MFIDLSVRDFLKGLKIVENEQKIREVTTHSRTEKKKKINLKKKNAFIIKHQCKNIIFEYARNVFFCHKLWNMIAISNILNVLKIFFFFLYYH